jgi:Putative transposase, YhgA-like
MPEPTAHTSRRRVSHRPSPRVIREFSDRGTLWLLEDPANLQGLVQIVEPALVEQLDFAHAERVNRSFIPADLQKQESDLIFRVPFIGGGAEAGEVWVYVLLEHQSKPDPLMGLRLYLYMGQLWDSQRRRWQDANLPAEQRRLHPIIPLVFYTGTAPWSAPIGLANLMDLPGELGRFVPRWETLFLNLHDTPPETLTQFTTAVGWALRVLQAEKAPLAEMQRVLAEALAGLEGLSEEQVGQWLRVAWYLALLVLHRRGEQELVDLVREQAGRSKFRLRKELAAVRQTLYQQMEEEVNRKVTGEVTRKVTGEVTRKVTGEVTLATMREALETVLTERFGTLAASIQQQLATADIDTMRTWLRAASRAATLEEIGIAPQDTES